MKTYTPKKRNEKTEMSRKKNIKCFSCEQWGHISTNCEEAKYENSTKTSVDVKTNIALLANKKKSREKNCGF